MPGHDSRALSWKPGRAEWGRRRAPLEAAAIRPRVILMACVPHAVRAARDPRVHEPAPRLVLLDLLAQELGVNSGMERQEGAPKQG